MVKSLKPTETFISKILKQKNSYKISYAIGEYVSADIPYNYANISKTLVYECSFLSTV